MPWYFSSQRFLNCSRRTADFHGPNDGSDDQRPFRIQPGNGHWFHRQFNDNKNSWAQRRRSYVDKQQRQHEHQHHHRRDYYPQQRHGITRATLGCRPNFFSQSKRVGLPRAGRNYSRVGDGAGVYILQLLQDGHSGWDRWRWDIRQGWEWWGKRRRRGRGEGCWLPWEWESTRRGFQYGQTCGHRPESRRHGEDVIFACECMQFLSETRGSALRLCRDGLNQAGRLRRGETETDGMPTTVQILCSRIRMPWIHRRTCTPGCCWRDSGGIRSCRQWGVRWCSGSHEAYLLHVIID